MKTPDWVALIIGVVGLVIGVSSLVVAVVAVVASRRSVEEARRSADHAGESAAEARRLTEIEADRRQEERERRHEELGPQLPGDLDAEFRPNDNLGPGHGDLYGTVTVDRTYRVKAEVCELTGRTEAPFGPVLEAGQPRTFHIERWLPDQKVARAKELVFRFWPPVEGVDGTGVWTCGCGRPGGETMDGPGHWEQRVNVSDYDVGDSVA